MLCFSAIPDKKFHKYLAVDNAEISAELVGTNMGTIKLTDENGALLLDSLQLFQQMAHQICPRRAQLLPGIKTLLYSPIYDHHKQ